MVSKLDIENMVFLIINEVSTIDSCIIVLLDYRLRQLTGCNKSFGGLSILLAGDFNQLGPVKKIFLPKDMMTWAARISKYLMAPFPEESQSKSDSNSKSRRTNREILKKRKMKKTRKKNKKETEVNRFKPSSIAYQGCYLFSRFVRFHLFEQQRAASDPVHNAFVQKLSAGNKIELESIKKYENLNKKDIQQRDWKFAPILVSTNIERLSIIRYKASLWAKEHKTYVLKWKCRIGNEQNRPSECGMEQIMEKNAFFWQCWVPGANAYLPYNINGYLSLVNGAPVITHSLSFNDNLDLEIITRAMNGLNK